MRAVGRHAVVRPRTWRNHIPKGRLKFVFSRPFGNFVSAGCNPIFPGREPNFGLAVRRFLAGEAGGDAAEHSVNFGIVEDIADLAGQGKWGERFFEEMEALF